MERARQNLNEEAAARVSGGADDQNLLQAVKRAVEALATLSHKVKAISMDSARQQEISTTVCSELVLQLVPVKHRETLPNGGNKIFYFCFYLVN